MAAEKDDSRIVPVHFCRVTVIFRCSIPNNLNMKELRFKRQKSLFSLVFQVQKPSVLLHFSLESEPTGKLPFHVRSPPVFYPLRRYENKWDFHQLMSTKSKMQSRRFCSQKNKQAVSLVDIVKSVGLFGEAISFLPLF